MIVEMAGRPEKHLTESLEKHVGILREVKDAEVHEIKVSEPRVIPTEKEVKEGEEMFTAFAECDFELPSFARLSETVFDFMPSSIEVIEPNSIEFSSTEATDLLNNISGRMHRYDEVAKIAGARLQHMGAQLQMAQKILMERDKRIAELEKKGSAKKAVKKATKKKAVKKATKKAVKKK